MTWQTATQTYMNARIGHGIRWLLWVSARNRTTHAEVDFGFWNDVYDRSFTVGGVSRTYLASYGAFEPPTLEFVKGLEIQEVQIPFRVIKTEIDALLRTYDVSKAPVELHKVLFDNDGEVLEIEQRFVGEVSRFPTVMPAFNGVSEGTLHCVSSARRGTLTIGAVKSNQSQLLRDGDDDFRSYATLEDVSSDIWGNRD